MRTRYVLVALGLTLAAGFLAGFATGSGVRDAAGTNGEADPPASTDTVRLVNRCGNLVTDDSGLAIELGLPTAPPPVDHERLASLADRVMPEGAPPLAVALRPPYAAAYATC